MRLIPATPLNRAYVASLTDKIAADAKLTSGRAAKSYMSGVGFVIVGVGGGIGAMLFGASFLINSLSANQREADRLAAMQRQYEADRSANEQHSREFFAAMLRQNHEETEALLKNTTLKTLVTVTGDVGIKQDAVVGMKDGLVKLAPDQTVHIDPASTVNIAQPAAAAIPRPSPNQLQANAAPASRSAVVTNYTVFKIVPFDEGVIQTGWKFDTSVQKTPSEQYCLYVYPANKGQRGVIDLGEDGRMLVPETPLAGFDVKAAFENCVWFSGTVKATMPPPPPASLPPPANIIRANNG